ncbi:MAG: leucine-rich repeat protein [Bacteroidales bacterium]|nr:leucine-rich repeat protein [Bacteroidales bacterium]
MKKSRNIILSVLLAVCAFCLCFALVGCKGGDKDAAAKYGYGEEGFYYYDGADSSRYMLSLQSGTYLMTVNNSTVHSGSYSYDEESGKVSFSGEGEFAATLGESAMSLDVEGSGYSFKAYRFFDVTYVDENGVAIATESVLNGQTAVSLDIEKDGYWFIDWYVDSSNSAVYSFDTSIAGETTIYGWFIEKNTSVTEHIVTLDYGDGYTETMSTMNGTIYRELPSSYNGQTVMGWWVSATNKSGELTYKYAAGEVFDADTTLFAVYEGLGSSVTSEGVTWDTARSGSSVTVTIYNANGRQVLTGNVSSSAGSFTSSAFTALESGTYTVEITSGNVTETRVYVVNGLARVSLSESDIIVNGSGRVLSFAPVEGADGYKITVTNGEKTVTEDLGSHTYYNFSDWEMTKDGITFVVTAYADGYADSVSDGFTYLLVLGNITLDISDDVVSWSRVDGALEYVVTVTDVDGNVIDSFRTSDTSFSLKYYENGTYDITVQPHTDGYYSEADTYFGYAKDSLMAPKITNVSGYEVSWEEIEEADSYVVLINGVEYATTDTTLLFSDYNVPATASSYEISVKAVKDGGSDSPYSDVIIATEEFSSAVSYDKNTIYWNYDIAAAYYGVSVNGGEETTTEGGNSFKVTLTKAGDNVITVTAYNASGVSLGSAEMTVYAYSVILDPNGATLVSGTADSNNTIYVAQGDELNLGSVEKDYADFVGWYTQADYTNGQSDVYEGVGSLVDEGSTFTGNGAMYLYAYWTYRYMDVTLYVDNDVFETVQIKYNSTSFVLDTPKAPSETQDFTGWYAQNKTQFTIETGAASGVPYDGTDKFYAQFLVTRSYTATKYNGETVYSVTATSNAATLTEMTVPEGYTYGGKTYGIILQNNAFKECGRLEVVNIPDTVVYIALTNGGYDSGTGPFANMKTIKYVNVYETGDEPDSTREINYFSEDGVLFNKINDAGDVQMLYFPRGRSMDTYYMPATVSNANECDAFGTPVTHKVTYIPTNAFRYRDVKEIVVPNTVTEVAASAFYQNTTVKKITFEEGGTEPLTMGNYVFRLCSSLTEVTLPARYSEFNYRSFYGASALVNISIGAGGVFSSDGGILLSADGSTIVYYPMARKGEVVISELTSGTISKIGDYAFANNTNITRVVIPASVTEIGVGAFQACTKLAEVVFEGNVNSARLAIRSNAFYGCSLITSVSLPANLTTLEANAFGNCTRLSSVYFDSFPGATTGDLDFAANAFGSDSYVYTIEFGANVPEFDFGSVFGSSRLETIIIAEGNTAYYSDTEAGSIIYNAEKTTLMYIPTAVSGEVEVLDSVTNLAANVFVDRVNITKISFGPALNTVPYGVFEGCTYLTAIVVDQDNENYSSVDGVLYELKDGVPVTLVYCPIANAETTLSVPVTVTYVMDRAFYGNTSVVSVSFVANDGNTEDAEDSRASFVLGDRVFYHSSSSTTLTTVYLPECMTEIPAYTFYNCQGLASVNIPSTVTKIGDYAFYYCSPLLGDLSAGKTEGDSYITLPEGLTYIGQNAFCYCKKLAVTIPATVEEIAYRAFYYCWDDSTSGKAPLKFASVAEDGAETPSDAAQTLVIGEQAFYYSQYVTGDVVIPKNVAEMGTQAFYNIASSSKSATLAFEDGFSLTTIPDSAFYGNGFTEIDIPACVETISASAFRSTGSDTLTGINFAENGKLSRIESSAFYNAAVTSIEIPASVEYIGQNAFSGAQFADQEETGATVKIDGVRFEEREGKPIEIVSSAFPSSKMTHFTCPDGLTVFNQIFGSNVKYLTEITFSSTVTEIGASAFSGATFTSFEVPAQIEIIGEKAFASCQNLSSVTFETGSNLAKMGDKVFYFCPSLTSFSFPESSNEIELGSSIFQSETGYGLHDDPDSLYGESFGEYVNPTPVTTVHISSSVRDIGAAFVDALYLESLTIAENHPTLELTTEGTVLYSKEKDTIVYVVAGTENVDFSTTSITTIKSYAFDSKDTIKSVTFSDKIVSIEDYAFRNCTALETVTFADSTVVNIKLGEGVFYGCDSLEKINLPDGISEIPSYFFYGCMSLMELELPSTVTTIRSYAFSGTGNMQFKDITDPDDDRYEGPTEFTPAFTLDASGVTTFEDHAFASSGIVSITLGSDGFGITFGSYLFNKAAFLEEIDLPYGMTSIPIGFFYGASSLERVGIPDTMTEIGAEVFRECTSLATMEFPESVKTLGYRLFTDCTSLKSVTLPEGITAITQEFFERSGIESITFPESVTSVELNAFYQCTSLEYVDFNHCFIEMGSASFYGCTSLVTILNYENLLNLGTGCFENSKITEFYGGEYLTAVDVDAFYGCRQLEYVTFEPGLISIGWRAFYNCSSLKTIILPKGLQSIGVNSTSSTSLGSAFYGCTSLEYLYIPSTVTTVAMGNSSSGGNFASLTCNLYIENTKNFVDANWTGFGGTNGWNKSFNGTVYYYSATEPTSFNEEGTDYDMNYWCFDDDENFCIWEYSPNIYTVSDTCYLEANTALGTILGIYVLDEATGSYSQVSFFQDADATDSIVVVIGDSPDTTSYTVELDSVTMTAKLTEVVTA